MLKVQGVKDKSQKKKKFNDKIQLPNLEDTANDLQNGSGRFQHSSSRDPNLSNQGLLTSNN